MPAYYDEEEGFVAEVHAQARRQRPKANLAALAGLAATVAVIGGGAFFVMGSVDQGSETVPVIRASEGPIKTTPADAGGEATRHIQMTAFDADQAVVPATTIGAPAAMPADEDLPHGTLRAAASKGANVDHGVGRALGDGLGGTLGGTLGGGFDGASPSAVPVSAALSYIQPSRPSSARDEGIDVVALDDGQIFMPQGLTTPRMPRLITSEAELLNTRRPTRMRSSQGEPVPARGEGSELAPPVSPIVRLRPGGLAERFAEARERDAAAEKLAELTREAERSQVQIQLGAYPERAKIEAEWSRMQDENTDILSGRALAVQQTISGGITYYRLRVGPFRSPQEASTVCQALKARGYDCLLAINTESRG
ncbi:MAG: SPOR domain-containing protein [Pseudomonadota bacterium]